jgi:hypothetical protein
MGDKPLPPVPDKGMNEGLQLSQIIRRAQDPLPEELAIDFAAHNHVRKNFSKRIPCRLFSIKTVHLGVGIKNGNASGRKQFGHFTLAGGDGASETNGNH